MLAMQYRIALPADYDMGIIRQRIAERGHLTDDLPQLAFKTYLYADRREPNALGSSYAPFYLWHDAAGMNAFLSGAGFAGVIESFGRPVVRTWSVWHAHAAADLSVATYATHESLAIPARAAIADVRDAEHTHLQTNVERGALAVVSAFDPTTWTAMRFRLWRDVVSAGENVHGYHVGHVSQPSMHHRS